MTRLSDSAYRLARETDRDIRRLRRKFWWQRNRSTVASVATLLLTLVLFCLVLRFAAAWGWL